MNKFMKINRKMN